MRLCYFDDNRLGLVTGDQVKDVTAALDGLPSYRFDFPRCDPVIAGLEALKPAIQAESDRSQGRPLSQVRLRTPVANPGKIVAAPVNYVEHLAEVRADAELHHGVRINEIRTVGLFLKATSSLIGVSDAVALRFLDRRNDHEVELAIVIGKTADKVSKDDALGHVAGYTIGLDMTLRGPEERSLRKSIDTYTVLGPWMVTADELSDPTGLGLTLEVNGEARQQANTRDLIMPVDELIAFASSYYTLLPGDILLSGTPEGVGSVHPGDTITAKIDRIGEIQVAVTAA